jgi:ribonuclease-3
MEATLEDNIGYHFRDQSHLTRALTRRAFANEVRQQGRHIDDQEVLCTLGDAVLKLVFVDLLIRAHYPTPEEITQEKKNLERQESLADIASQLGIGSSIRFNTGEKKQGAEKEPYVLAETLEAILGAIYLDGGHAAAREAVMRWFSNNIKPYGG